MAEPQSPPKLTVVEGGPDALAAPARPARRWALWVAIALCLLLAWLWLTQLERANGLEARGRALESELAQARADLASWEQHMDAVRGEVEVVASRLANLQALVAAPPIAAPAEAPTTAPQAPSAPASPASPPAR